MRTTFLIHCPDQSGIIHSVTGFIHSRGGNIVYLDQHVDEEAGVFFMRLQCEFESDKIILDVLDKEFKEITKKYTSLNI